MGKKSAFKQILYRHNAISFPVAKVMKEGLKDKMVPKLNQCYFLKISTSSLWISPYFWRNCLLEILTLFSLFLPSVERLLCVSCILCVNWNFVSTADFSKSIFSLLENIMNEFRRNYPKLFSNLWTKCFIINWSPKNLLIVYGK